MPMYLFDNPVILSHGWSHASSRCCLTRFLSIPDPDTGRSAYRLDSSAEERTLLAARGRELALQEPVAPQVVDNGAIEAPKTDVRSPHVWSRSGH